MRENVAFENTPEWLARFLSGCPAYEPKATDHEVGVVVEDREGQMVPVVGAWYDELTGAVRLTIEEEFK